MRSLRWRRAFLLCVAASLLHCEGPSETTAGVPACVPHTGYRFPCVNVIYPNGGESFRVGDSLTMLFCSNDTLTCSLVEDEDLQITFDAGQNWYTIAYGPGFEYGWRIPDSLAVPSADGQAQKISTVSDRCGIRLHRYNFFGTEFDESDGEFSIAAR